MPTFPSIVTSGGVISAAHMNSIRTAILAMYAEQYAPTANIAHSGFNVTGVGVLSSASLTVSGAASAASLALSGALTGVTTGAFSGAVTAVSLTTSAGISGTTGTFSGAVAVASVAASGAATVGTTLTVTGNVGMGRSPTANLDVYRATGFAEIKLECGGSADTGYILKDVNRQYKFGINVAAAGVGKFSIYNYTTASNRLVIDDTVVHLMGQVRTPGLSSFANNAAAIAGGKTAGDEYLVSGTDPRQKAVVF